MVQGQIDVDGELFWSHVLRVLARLLDNLGSTVVNAKPRTLPNEVTCISTTNVHHPTLDSHNSTKLNFAYNLII